MLKLIPFILLLSAIPNAPHGIVGHCKAVVDETRMLKVPNPHYYLPGTNILIVESEEDDGYSIAPAYKVVCND